MKHRSDSVLEAKQLSCIRGDNLLFEGLNFTVNAGEIHQVHGVNGAGKTSLLRLVSGLSEPESGTISWNKADIHEQRETYTEDLLYLWHLPGIKTELSPSQNLKAIAVTHGADPAVDINDVLATVGLYGYEDTPCRFLSAGQKRRVALARLYFSTAQLWLLDEPATALDVKGVATFQERLEHHAKQGGMVILTSHQPLEFGSVKSKGIQL